MNGWISFFRRRRLQLLSLCCVRTWGAGSHLQASKGARTRMEFMPILEDEEIPELALCHVTAQKGSCPSSGNAPTGTLISHFLASRTLRNKCLLFKPLPVLFF